MNTTSPEVDITGYRPGALAAVLGMHMAYYSQHWGFGKDFETKVSSELAEFMGRYNPEFDLFLSAWSPDDVCVASISLDSQDVANKGAHLRWFIVDQAFTGSGIGRELMQRVIDHCDERCFEKIYLSTFKGLHAARKLYESFNFELVEELEVDQWSGSVKEQTFVREKID